MPSQIRASEDFRPLDFVNDSVFVWDSSEYRKQTKKLIYNYEKAYMRACLQLNKDIGDHYLLIGQWYHYTMILEKNSGIPLRGVYVNGITGDIQEVYTEMKFNSKDPRMRLKHKVLGIDVAPRLSTKLKLKPKQRTDRDNRKQQIKAAVNAAKEKGRL